MKLWNLSEFAELEENILVPYVNPERQVRSPVRQNYKQTRLKIMVGVVVVASYFTIGAAQANSQNISLPLSAMAVAQSIPEEKPPLEGLFRNRFDEDWTENLENSLLDAAEQRRQPQSREMLVEQTIDTIFSNQQEGLSLEVPKLDRAHIANLVHRRKIVR